MYVPTPILSSAPAVEPVSRSEMKAHLRVAHGAEDALIDSLSLAARHYVEAACDRQLITATWQVKLPDFGWTCYDLPYPPLQSISSVTYLDTNGASQTLASTVYNAVTWQTPGRIELADGQSWPATDVNPGAVTITFIAGYGTPSTVPEAFKLVIKLLVGGWYENREAAVQVQQGLPPAEVPYGVTALLSVCKAHRF